MSETLLGVILVGFIGGICGIITVSTQYFFDSQKHKKKKIDEINALNRSKKEMAYSQFMNLKSILIGFQYGFSKAENKELYHTDFETIWGTELKVH